MSFPSEVTKLLHQRVTPHLASTIDKLSSVLLHLLKRLANISFSDLLSQLAKVGFKTNLGPENSGIMQLFLRRVGGYYIGAYLRFPSNCVFAKGTVDFGASQRIIDGSIKVKSGVKIQSFDESGILFEDGTRLDADVVIFATGYAPISVCVA